ncbi:MAG: hypothetical protein ACKO0Z_20950 [Betaproteobacteria bacterium]
MATTNKVQTMGNIAYIGGVTLGKIGNAPGRNHYHITSKAGDRRQIVIGKKKALDLLLQWHNEAKEAEAAEQAAAEQAYHAEQAQLEAAAQPAQVETPAQPEAAPADDDSAAQAEAELADVATQADFAIWSDKWQAYTLVRKADGAALAAVAHWGDKKGREIAEFSLDNGKTSYPYYDQIGRYFDVAVLQPK